MFREGSSRSERRSRIGPALGPGAGMIVRRVMGLGLALRLRGREIGRAVERRRALEESILGGTSCAGSTVVGELEKVS